MCVSDRPAHERVPRGNLPTYLTFGVTSFEVALTYLVCTPPLPNVKVGR